MTHNYRCSFSPSLRRRLAFSNMQIFHCVFVILNFSLVFSQNKNDITYVIPHQFKPIGSTVELTCETVGTANSPMVWTRNVDSNRSPRYPITLTTGRKRVIADLRFSSETQELENDVTKYILRIKDVQQNDTGRYQCRFLVGFSNQLANEIRLEVGMPPNMIIRVGESVRIQCFDDDDDKQWRSVSWGRENNEILPTDTVLYTGNYMDMTEVQKIDSGMYYCEADDGVNKGVKHYFTVQVVK